MELDPIYIPRPITNDRLFPSFCIPIGMDIAYASNLILYAVPFAQTLGRFCSFHQILENDKLLLVLLDRDKVSIYLDQLPGMDIIRT